MVPTMNTPTVIVDIFVITCRLVDDFRFRKFRRLQHLDVCLCFFLLRFWFCFRKYFLSLLLAGNKIFCDCNIFIFEWQGNHQIAFKSISFFYKKLFLSNFEWFFSCLSSDSSLDRTVPFWALAAHYSEFDSQTLSLLLDIHSIQLVALHIDRPRINEQRLDSILS